MIFEKEFLLWFNMMLIPKQKAMDTNYGNPVLPANRVAVETPQNKYHKILDQSPRNAFTSRLSISPLFYSKANQRFQALFGKKFIPGVMFPVALMQ